MLGGGGRYDGLLKRFGLDLPAAGFALYLERVHVAQMEEERRERGGRPMSGVAGMGGTKADGPLKLAVPRGALFDGTLDLLDAVGIDTAARARRLALADLPRRARSRW